MNKFHAEKTWLGGEQFDSKKEAQRYLELCLLQRAGKIADLKRQVRYTLVDAKYNERGKKIFSSVDYIADFVYRENGKLIVEDVKGYRHGPAYQHFVTKKKLMYDKYGIIVRET